MAQVVMTTEAAKEFDKLPRPVQARVTGIFHRLIAWPNVSGAKPLRGTLAGHFRIRTGDYRVQFHLEGETVVVEKMGHRDGFYE